MLTCLAVSIDWLYKLPDRVGEGKDAMKCRWCKATEDYWKENWIYLPLSYFCKKCYKRFMNLLKLVNPKI
jgi:hypothetical protein